MAAIKAELSLAPNVITPTRRANYGSLSAPLLAKIATFVGLLTCPEFGAVCKGWNAATKTSFSPHGKATQFREKLFKRIQTPPAVIVDRDKFWGFTSEQWTQFQNNYCGNQAQRQKLMEFLSINEDQLTALSCFAKELAVLQVFEPNEMTDITYVVRGFIDMSLHNGLLENEHCKLKFQYSPHPVDFITKCSVLNKQDCTKNWEIESDRCSRDWIVPPLENDESIFLGLKQETFLPRFFFKNGCLLNVEAVFNNALKTLDPNVNWNLDNREPCQAIKDRIFVKFYGNNGTHALCMLQRPYSPHTTSIPAFRLASNNFAVTYNNVYSATATTLTIQNLYADTYGNFPRPINIDLPEGNGCSPIFFKTAEGLMAWKILNINNKQLLLCGDDTIWRKYRFAHDGASIHNIINDLVITGSKLKGRFYEMRFNFLMDPATNIVFELGEGRIIQQNGHIHAQVLKDRPVSVKVAKGGKGLYFLTQKGIVGYTL